MLSLGRVGAVSPSTSSLSLGDAMSGHFVVLGYDTALYPFRSILAAHVYRVRQLDRLHESWRLQTRRTQLTYSDNLRLRRLMQRLPDSSPFYRLYHLWIARVLAPHYGGKIRYSAHPKMRVHLAGTGCVSDFHCDADVLGRDDQINCYLPFTDVHDSCTVWCETGYGSGDYRPLNLDYGQALLWDGGRLKHGTVFNETDSTRVSCDFRFTAKDLSQVASPWRDVLSGRPAPAPITTTGSVGFTSPSPPSPDLGGRPCPATLIN